MKEIFEKTYYHNSLAEWAWSLVIILASVLLAKLVYWIIKRFVKTATQKTRSRLDHLLVDMIEEPFVVFIVLIGISYALNNLQFTDWLESWIGKVVHIAFTINFTWLVVRVIDSMIQEFVIPLTAKTESDFDDQIVPIARKGIRWILWTLGIILALNNAGYDVAALLAGLGLGGLALAMAAKDTVANIFGGVTIFTDKPFKVFDRIKISGYDGIVEEVGVRSTRIRTLEGRVLTIPNHFFTDMVVENVSSEPSRKIVLKLGLTYDTSPEKIQKAIDLLKQIQENDAALENKRWVNFDTFGDFSLGITFIYYISPGNDIPEVQSRINMKILQEFNHVGLDFAFPTRTIITDKSINSN